MCCSDELCGAFEQGGWSRRLTAPVEFRAFAAGAGPRCEAAAKGSAPMDVDHRGSGDAGRGRDRGQRPFMVM